MRTRGKGGLNMTIIRILYAGLLKIQQYLTHLRIDNSSQHRLRSAHVNSMIMVGGGGVGGSKNRGEMRM